jgi:arginase
MRETKSLYLLGYASGIAGAKRGSAEGPLVMQQSPYLMTLAEQGITFDWPAMIKTPHDTEATKLSLVRQQCFQLAQAITPLVEQKKFFIVLGGDHTSAIGTWSGVSAVTHKEGPLGLIWIDAHMDSHTPETTSSGNLHGMPLACLLGHGDSSLVNLMEHSPKIKPEHICLIGVRSYEAAEAKLLNQLKVRIFYIDEVKQRGLPAVMAEAVSYVSQNTIGYGLSIDIDSIDPIDAPGTGVAEPNGIRANELYDALNIVANDPRLLGAEIVEFDPNNDTDHLTEKLIVRLISIIAGVRSPAACPRDPAS